MLKSKELCPFCGGVGELVTDGEEGEFQDFYVECTDGECGFVRLPAWGNEGYSTAVLAIAAWDKRAVPKSEYDELISDQKLLHALQRGGVDNWEWYDDALELLDED